MHTGRTHAARRRLLFIGVSAVGLWSSPGLAQVATPSNPATAAPLPGEETADPQTVPEAIQTQGGQVAESDPATTATPVQTGEIVVTGSRIGRSGFTTPTPVSGTRLAVKSQAS